VATFGTEQLMGQIYRVVVANQMLPAEDRGHKVRPPPAMVVQYRTHQHIYALLGKVTLIGQNTEAMACLHALAKGRPTICPKSLSDNSCQKDAKYSMSELMTAVTPVQRLGRREALSHVAQLVMLFTLGAYVMSQDLIAPGQLRACFAIFGIVYALQVCVADSLNFREDRMYIREGIMEYVMSSVRFCNQFARITSRFTCTRFKQKIAVNMEWLL
jgi:hypothetical protein